MKPPLPTVLAGPLPCLMLSLALCGCSHTLSSTALKALSAGALKPMPMSGGANPLSSAIHMASTSASHSVGLAQASVVSPQEQAQFDAMPCPQLQQMAANYQNSLSATPAPKKYGGMAPPNQDIVQAIIHTRLDALAQTMQKKGC